MDNLAIIAMPYLQPWYIPPFNTIGEVVDFIQQAFEGLQFMHEHRLIHQDINTDGVLMGEQHLAVSTFHPMQPSRTFDLSEDSEWACRTRHPVKYYYVNFSRAKPCPHEVEPPGVTKVIHEGITKWRPREKSYPFHEDVYNLANMIRESVTEGSCNPRRQVRAKRMSWVGDLLKDMMQQDPTKRPTMDEVMPRLVELKSKLKPWMSRSRFAYEDENLAAAFFQDIFHWWWQIYYIFLSIPAIPKARGDVLV